MSTKPVQALVPEPPKPKRVPDLTSAYRKAHKNYVLVAGLLAAWELIGIDPDKLGEKWGIILKTPKGVPLVLVTLLLYSGYKVTIEWVQCDPERRANVAARLDYRIAHLMALGTIVVGLVQYLARIRIADILSQQTAVGLATYTALLVISIRVVVTLLKHGQGHLYWWLSAVFSVIGFIALAFGIQVGLELGKNYFGWLLGIAGGIVISAGVWRAVAQVLRVSSPGSENTADKDSVALF
jgi:hypothetical protein